MPEKEEFDYGSASRFFDSLVELVPAKYYLDTDEHVRKSTADVLRGRCISGGYRRRPATAATLRRQPRLSTQTIISRWTCAT